MRIIKYFSLLLALMVSLAVNADFNPTNPPDPGVPVTKYKLSVTCTPAGGGSVSPSSGQYAEGTSVSLRVTRNTNYDFVGWFDDNGVQLGNSTYCYVTMPAEDLHITAKFNYNPSSPSDPSVPPTYATVTTTVTPAGAATVTGAGRYVVGSTVRINASYLSTNYTFKNFTVDGEVVSTSRSFNYVVRESGNDIVCNCEFNPTNPSDPPAPVKTYTVYAQMNPAAGGYVSPTSASAAEGETVSLSASCYNNYRFISWTDAEGNVLSKSTRLNYVMGASNARVTANVEFNPASPSDPSGDTVHRNMIYGSRRSTEAGRAILYDVMLQNVDEVNGISIDLKFPDGFTADWESVTTGERASGHTVTVQQVDGTTRRLFLTGTSPVSGTSGVVLRVPVQIPSGLEEGSSHIVQLSKGVVFRADGVQETVAASEGLIKIAENEITLPDSPDFRVSDIRVATTNLMPGDQLEASWKVSNAGTAASNGGWSETLWLTDSNGHRSSLGTVYYNTDSMEIGEEVSRMATVTIPALPGIDGDLDLIISLTPNVASGEIEQYQVNNISRTDNSPIRLGKTLQLEIPAALTEGTDGLVRCRLSRSGSWFSTETFNLVKKRGDGRVSIPGTVTIPKDQSGAYFKLLLSDNDQLDEDTELCIEASGAGYAPVEVSAEVVDDEYPEIELTLSAERLTEGESAVLTATLPRPAQEDLILALSADIEGHVRMPATMTVRAGEVSTQTEISAIDDSKIGNSVDISIFATAPHYGKGEVWLYVDDNDMPLLELELTPTEVSEGAGPRAMRGILRRVTNTGVSVNVNLSDDSNGALDYTKKFTLDKGVDQVDFNIGVVDNAIVEGDRTVNITAAVYMQACSCSATTESGGSVTKTLTIIDNDGPSLQLTADRTTLRRDATESTLVIKRNTRTDKALDVELACDTEGALEMPANVTIAAGSESVTVNIRAAASAFAGEEKVVVVNVMADGYSKGTAMLLISDRTLSDAVVEMEVDNTEPYMPGAQINVKATVRNEGNAEMKEAAGVDLLIGSESSARAYTTRKLSPGESETLTLPVRLPEVPGEYKLVLHVNDAVNFEELTLTNNSSQTAVVTVKSPFAATVSVDKDVIGVEDQVTVSGMAPGYGKTLEVYYTTSGVRRTAVVTPDAEGKFSVALVPGYPGDYIAGVCIPGENKNDDMAGFHVVGLNLSLTESMSFDLEQGETATRSFTLTNMSSVPVKDLRIEADAPSELCKVEISAPSSLDPKQSATVSIKTTALQITEGKDWVTFPMKLTADNGLSTERTLYFYCRPGQAKLVPSVNRISTSMVVGEQRVYRFSIGNTGKKESGDVTLALPSFMKTGTATTLPSIEPGATQYVDLVLTPAADMQLNVPVHGTIGVNCANGEGFALPFDIEPVSDRTGRLIVDVKDEYTFYDPAKPHVEGADIMVTHPVTGKMLAHGKSDANGLWETTLPEGYYVLEVSASKHGSHQETFMLDPGIDNEKAVFLPFDAISYSFSVEETTVDDEYEIINTVEFETRVPKPVVLVEFPKLRYANQLVNISVTNKGLIKATNIEAKVPASTDQIRFSFAGEHIIPELLPGETRQIPVLVTVDQEGAYPDFDMSVSSYTMTSDTGDFGGGSSKAAARSGSGCVTSQMDVEVDDPDCDPLTGEPIYGKKKTVQANYRSGDCGGPYHVPDGIGAPSLPSWGGGAGGPGGRPGGGGGGNGGHTSTYWQDRARTFLMTGCASDCEKALADAIKKCWDALMSCKGIDFDPSPEIVKCVKGLAEGCDGFGKGGVKDKKDCARSAGKCIPPLGCPLDIEECIEAAYKAFKECMKLYKHRKGQKVVARAATTTQSEEDEDAEITAKEKRAESVVLSLKYRNLLRKDLLNLLGAGNWTGVSTDDILAVLDYVSDNVDADGYALTGETAAAARPAGVDAATFISFLERYNNSLRYEQTGEASENMLDYEENVRMGDELAAMRDDALELGYPTFSDFMTTAFEEMESYLDMAKDPSDGLCTSITLQFKQSLVLTRQAFRGTLSVTNGNEEVAMTGVTFRPKVRDAEGNLVGEREFAITSETLNGFEGENALGASWTLPGSQTGDVTMLFIPSKYAAPVEPAVYSFGGTLGYVDPFTGVEITRELDPIEMTVSPSPLLDLDYFMQRDVIADDPLTEEKVEAAEPAEFALVIRNKGYGEASNMRMTTLQPEIVENSRGLAIDFRIIGSSLRGVEQTMAIGEKIPTEFGNLAPQATTYAQWWMQSSILGHFTSYDVKYTQVSAYGSEDMSLLDNVRVHELIHGFTPEGGDDKARAFLVNDIDDVDTLPDIVWFSETADSEEVATVKDAAISDLTESSCLLTVPAGEGWTYGNIAAPWTGSRIVTAVKRLSDNAELPADNVWCTAVTMRNSTAPVHEEKLHFIVNLTGSSEKYLLTLEGKPEVELQVNRVDGLPDEDDISVLPVEEVIVSFNKPIDSESFDSSDLTLTCGGKPVDVTGVEITPAPAMARIGSTIYRVASTDYNVSFKGATGAGGFYTLTVNPTGITDAEGFKGSEPVVSSWSQLSDGKVDLVCMAEPAEGGAVSPAEGRVDYNKEVIVKATPNEGYEFTKWTRDGDYASDNATLKLTPRQDTNLVAYFAKSMYDVEVEVDPEKGWITGGSTGMYEYGTTLTLTAVPEEGYEFDRWVDREGETIGTSPVFTTTVKGDLYVEALFKATRTGVAAAVAEGSTIVYPTAVRTRLNIAGDFTCIESLTVTDTDGLRSRRFTDLPKGMPVNLETLQPGVYLVRIVTDIDVTVHKIVKL